MIFAVPIIGEILGSLATSQAGSASTAQKTGAQKVQSAASAAAPADFTQTVDNLNRAGGAKAPQHSGLASRI